MRMILSGLALALIAGCSQQQICESRVTKELRTINGLVATTEANLARGYGLQVIERPVERRYRCSVTQPDGSKITQICTAIDIERERKPVALDLDAEAAKLRSLKTRQTQMQSQAQAALAQCATLAQR